MKQLPDPSLIIRSGLCIGCGSCVAQASTQKIKMAFDKYGFLKPDGDKTWLHKPSESFNRTCPFSYLAKNENELANDFFPSAKNKNDKIGHFQSAYAGYVNENNFRMEGSSGGMTTWIATELLKKGWINAVAHVVAARNPQRQGRYFYYRLSQTEAEIQEGAKSRYYPTEMSQVIKAIRKIPGRYAVIGIPCFIKALQLLREEDLILRKRIRFTLGLFCGHMKSARFIESFAWQMNVPADKIKAVEFRHKDPGRPANWYNARLTLDDGNIVNKDWWHLVDGDWGAGFFMNPACNYCDDVVAETADVSFGDAWIEPYSSDGKGANIVVVRSSLIHQLIADGIKQKRLMLKEVSSKLVEQTQAAGFRQRREGLAYRLSLTGKAVRKRVAASSHISIRRKIIYRLRYAISLWSHRIFLFAKKSNRPSLYINWAKIIIKIYDGITYHRGKTGRLFKWMGIK